MYDRLPNYKQIHLAMSILQECDHGETIEQLWRLGVPLYGELLPEEPEKALLASLTVYVYDKSTEEHTAYVLSKVTQEDFQGAYRDTDPLGSIRSKAYALNGIFPVKAVEFDMAMNTPWGLPCDR